MATSGKKGKKSKPKSMPLGNFLTDDANTKTLSTTQVTKTYSWAEEVEEEEFRAPMVVSLPTGPRSSRANDDVPEDPPYMAHLSNLPWEVEEDDIKELFADFQIESVRLPRDDGSIGKSRGFGYVEFQRRNDLIAALSMPDPHIQGRRIRIDLSTESDQKRGGGRGRYDNYSSSGDTNWRKERNDDAGGEGGGNRRGGGGSYGGYGNKDYEAATEGGNWRTNMKQKTDSPPPIRRPYDRDGDRDRDRGGDRDRDRGGDRDRDRGYNKDRYGGRSSGGRYDDRNSNRESETPAERPKLNLKPRTLPLPEIVIPPTELERKVPESKEIELEEEPEQPAPTPVPAADIFGDAKPVDTSVRDREIEQRLERERLERLESEAAAAAEQKEKAADEESSEKEVEPVEPVVVNSWRRRNEDTEENGSRTQSPPRRRYSPDRRGLRRNDDRRGGRDNKDYDNRDYNRRDNRDFRDNRESRDNRNRDHRDQRGDRNRGDNYNRGDRGGFRDNKEQSGGYRDNKESGGSRSGDRDYQKYGGKPVSTAVRDDKPIRRGVEKPDTFDETAPKDIEARMPKYQAPVKPKLQMSNAYEFLDDDGSE